MLISWRAPKDGAFGGTFHGIVSQFTTVKRENTCKFGRLLRFTSPASGRIRAGHKKFCSKFTFVLSEAATLTFALIHSRKMQFLQ